MFEDENAEDMCADCGMPGGPDTVQPEYPSGDMLCKECTLRRHDTREFMSW